MELILADLETINKRLQRVEKMARQKDKDAMFESDVLLKLKEGLEAETPARAMEFSEDQWKIVKGLQLLTSKPALYVANVEEDEIRNTADNEKVKKVNEYA